LRIKEDKESEKEKKILRDKEKEEKRLKRR
jgi:hypothetical protein